MAWRFKASKYKNAAPLEPKLDLHIRSLFSLLLVLGSFAKVKFQGPCHRLVPLMRQLHCCQCCVPCLQLGFSWIEVTTTKTLILPSTSHLPPQPRRSASGDKGSSGQGDNPKDRRALLPRHRLCLLTPRRRAAGHREPRPDGEDLFLFLDIPKTFIQVKIWRIPRTGLSSNLTVPEVSL